MNQDYTARAEDISSIDQIIGALYEVVSGPAGSRDWARMRSLFWPGARMIPTRSAPEVRAEVLSIEEFIAIVEKNIAQEGFYERELSRRTEQFGYMTHVFSAYECKRTPEDPTPFMRGVNSIHLLYDKARYWVLTVFWDVERADNPLPSLDQP